MERHRDGGTLDMSPHLQPDGLIRAVGALVRQLEGSPKPIVDLQPVSLDWLPIA